MARKDSYVARLRNIILHSVDIIPEKVAEYLEELVAYGHWDDKKHVLLNAFPLIKHKPQIFVDFALKALIKPVRRRRPQVTQTNISDLPEEMVERLAATGVTPEDLFRTYIDEDEDYEPIPKYGIEDYMIFFPPSHVQCHGAFIMTLSRDEDEGLRLVHGLANHATQQWRKKEQQNKLTPLPVKIVVDNDLQDFWGNDQVYCWYRGISVGSDAVVSVLMALEFWMEQQIKDDRNVEELFEKVLRGSFCIAVPGICVSLALGYPDKCLKAVLPILSAPRIWEMDIFRHTSDKISNSLNLSLLQNSWIDKLNKLRNELPRRSQEIRSLAMRCMLSSDKFLKELFLGSVATFNEELLFDYEEQRSSPSTIKELQEQARIYRAFGDIVQYRLIKAENGQTQIWVEPPKEILQEAEQEFCKSLEHKKHQHVLLWTWQILRDGKKPEGMTLEEAVEAAQSFQHSDDFLQPLDLMELNGSIKLQAIAGVAAAILVTDFTWTRDRNLIEWSRKVLLAAARMCKNPHHVFSQGMFAPALASAKGLAVLIENGAKDSEVQAQLLLLAASSEHEIVQAVFQGLYKSWLVDEVLCWNALSLRISLCIHPYYSYTWQESDKRDADEKERKMKTITQHLDFLAQKIIPEFPKVQELQGNFEWGLINSTLQYLPLEVLVDNQILKDRLLSLTDDLLAWTVEENRNYKRYHSQPLIEWNYFFPKFLVYMARFINLEEIKEHILNPFRNCWEESPQLTARLLSAYIGCQITGNDIPTQQAVTAWKEICDWVLNSSIITNQTKNRYFGNEFLEVVSRILFVEHGRYSFDDNWSYASLFADTIEKLVKTIGNHPEIFAYLITMMNGATYCFIPEPALEWIDWCSESSLQDFWTKHNNGEKTATLLQHIWSHHEATVRNFPLSLERYSRLVDRLVAAGIPLAAFLLDCLERRKS